MQRVQEKNQDVITSQRISNDEFRCGGYFALNIGTATAKVNGYPLAPGEGLDRTAGVGFIEILSPIDIELTSGAIIRLTQYIYV